MDDRPVRTEQHCKKPCKKLIKGFEGVRGNFFQKFPHVAFLQKPPLRPSPAQPLLNHTPDGADRLLLVSAVGGKGNAVPLRDLKAHERK